MAENTSGSAFDQRLMESPLSEQEQALRDLFVNEYMKDFDPYHACIRVGFMASFAIEWAKRFLQESYVQRRIAELTRATQIDAEEEMAADKALIINTLRQAAQHGPYASRVSAAAKLAEIRGLSKPDGSAGAEQALIDAFRDIATKVPV